MSFAGESHVSSRDEIGADVDEFGYETRLAEARNLYTKAPGFTAVTGSDSEKFLHRFLIEFSSLGVQMTEPVDGWIRRAGARCQDLGLDDLGAALIRHAAHEAGHHKMMIADTHNLVADWNNAGHEPLNADELITRPATLGVQAYIDLHEETIASEAPFGQLAIEYEIELLSLTAGPLLMGRVATVCGPERLAHLSFLEDHIEIDAGHTVFNRRQLEALLGEHPDMLPELGAAGVAALAAHAQFIDDCAAGAKQ